MTAVTRLIMLIAALGCVLALDACATGSPASRAACLPSPLHIDPLRVEAGRTVTVSSPAFACRGGYSAGHRYTLILGQVGRSAPVRLGVFTVSRDGAFRAVARIPRGASPGQSYVIVRGSPFDHCTGTNGVSGSCAGYDATVYVLRRT